MKNGSINTQSENRGNVSVSSAACPVVDRAATSALRTMTN